MAYCMLALLRLLSVPRQFVYGHFVYDTSSADISCTDISSTTVYHYQRVGQLGLYVRATGLPVLKVTNSRSSFGKIPKIPVVKLMIYLHANTFIIDRKLPTLTNFYQPHKINFNSHCL